jgi:hypothetical protein
MVFLGLCTPQRHSAGEPQPKKDAAGIGQYRFAVASGESRDAENLMIIETHPTLPRIGTDLCQHYCEWQDILSEETFSEKQDLRNLAEIVVDLARGFA